MNYIIFMISHHLQRRDGYGSEGEQLEHRSHVAHVAPFRLQSHRSRTRRVPPLVRNSERHLSERPERRAEKVINHITFKNEIT